MQINIIRVRGKKLFGQIFLNVQVYSGTLQTVQNALSNHLCVISKVIQDFFHVYESNNYYHNATIPIYYL